MLPGRAVAAASQLSSETEIEAMEHSMKASEGRRFDKVSSPYMATARIVMAYIV